MGQVCAQAAGPLGLAGGALLATAAALAGPLALASAAPIVEVPRARTTGGEVEPAPAGPRPAGMHRVAFFALKGGVGRTTLLTEAAAALARAGVAVGIIDLDLLSPGVATRLGIGDPGLADAISAGPDVPIAQFLVRHEPSGIRALLGVLRPVLATHQRRLAVRHALEAMDHLEATGCEVCLVDVGRDIDASCQQVLDAVDAIYCVFTPAPSAVHAVYRAVELLARFGWRPRLELVLNQAGAEDDASEVVADLGLRLAAVVPYEAELMGAEGEHEPASLHPGAAARALQPLASALRTGHRATAG